MPNRARAYLPFLTGISEVLGRIALLLMPIVYFLMILKLPNYFIMKNNAKQP